MNRSIISNLRDAKVKLLNGLYAVRVKIFQDPGETINVSVNPSENPVIYNLSAPTANTEVSQVLNTNTKQVMIKVRGNAKAQLAFVATQSGTNFITIPSGSTMSLTNLKTSDTLYIQTDKNGQIIEILEWT